MKSLWRDGDRVREVETTSLGGGRWRVRVDVAEFELSAEVMPDGSQRFVRLGSLDLVLEREVGGRKRAASRAQTGGLEAPMPGVITKVMVVVGDDVAKGQPLLALEAM